jgi:hypothetical protein
VVLKSLNEAVGQKAINLLVKIHLAENFQLKRKDILQLLINEIMSLLDCPKTSTFEIQRILLLLRALIYESEKSGTAFV